MATVPGALLLCISSPYARRGEFWKAYRAHYGHVDSPVLVWRADTRTMNPTVPSAVIDQAYAEDKAVARAEYGAEFRRDLESFVSREALDAVTVDGRQPQLSSRGCAILGGSSSARLPAGSREGDECAHTHARTGPLENKESSERLTPSLLQRMNFPA